uniref:Uncharacterized protein n=1 Tax=Romanomermis culicivorax TaxID=13658 RepID=A0A915IYX4_ROMCU
MWYLLIIIASFGCVSLCRKGYLDYVKYAVRTNVHLDVPMKESPFIQDVKIPNLSFCGYKTIKNSLYHNDRMAQQFAMKILTAYIPSSTNAAQWMNDFVLAHGSKRRRRRQFVPDQDEKPAEPFDFQAFVKGDNLYNEFIEMASKIWTNCRVMTLQCSQKGLSFPCIAPSNPIMFSDSYTDDGLCFMFEHDREWVKNVSTEISLHHSKLFMKPRPHDLVVVTRTLTKANV